MSSQHPIDSVLLVSFGGPEAPEEVMPFLRNVTSGRNVPEDRLLSVAEHYQAFGGRSPINDQNRELIGALRTQLDNSGIHLPIYWGNRNWDPMLGDTLAQMRSDGMRNAVAFVTSAYSSYSGCRQYRCDISKAQQAAGPDAPSITKLRQFFNHPGFIDAFVRSTRTALEGLEPRLRDGAALVFTAHSIPEAMASGSRYESQLAEASRLVAAEIGEEHRWDLVFQSRSGPPSVPWLEPDVNDHLEVLAKAGTKAAVLIPIGFVSDHMEVVHDLDVEAKETAERLNMVVTRAKTPGTDSAFVATIVELIQEVLEPETPARALGELGVVSCLGDACCPATTAG
jgi:protoporphyrin/coproporphyrin ferrochelatase